MCPQTGLTSRADPAGPRSSEPVSPVTGPALVRPATPGHESRTMTVKICHPYSESMIITSLT